MNWAIIKTGGKQYKIAEGDKITVDKAQSENGVITFDKVLLIKSEKGIVLGQPLVKKAKVMGKLQENFKGKKVRVVKFKPKSRYLRTHGHRQQLSTILIEKIIL